MNEEARVAELTDLLSQELDSLRAIAENDSLRNVKLREEGVEAVKLFLLLQESVILGQTLQCQLISDFDVLRRGHVSLLEGTNFDWICSAE